MDSKSSFVLYTDHQDQIELLSMEQRGMLLTAIYAHVNKAPKPDMDAVTAMAFAFIRAQIDRDAGKWEEIKAKRAEAGRAGGIAKSEKQKIANASKASNGKLCKANLAVTVPVPVTVPVSVNESTGEPPPAVSPTLSQKSTKKKYGPYGWIQLTDEEHSRLLNDLGESEFKRCVAYIDESAQVNGNKNKWRDWNAVLRKCSREGWGGQAPPPPKKRTGNLETVNGEEVFVFD